MSRLVSFLRRCPAFLAELLVRGYQAVLSPLLVGHCKFVPSCSEYCAQAIREWGVLKGSWLAARRLVRCHPFGHGGIDPVPRRRREGEATDSP
jgi:putative membrane protein insertion efficiency factor